MAVMEKVSGRKTRRLEPGEGIDIGDAKLVQLLDNCQT
jgi:hypothetical protein